MRKFAGNCAKVKGMSFSEALLWFCGNVVGAVLGLMTAWYVLWHVRRLQRRMRRAGIETVVWIHRRSQAYDQPLPLDAEWAKPHGRHANIPAPARKAASVDDSQESQEIAPSDKR